MTNRTFQINMPSVGQSYADKVTVGSWLFGPDGDEKPMQTSATDPTTVTSMEILENKMYTITVTGDMNLGTLKAWVSNVTDIPSNAIGGSL
jgi:hypothetical protein